MGGGERTRAEAPSSVVDALLRRAERGPGGLLIEGEAGIGKTTLWAEAVKRAGETGFRVLTARASASQARLTFSVLGDLLEGVDPAALERLPGVQHVALNRVLLRSNDGPVTDERVAAAAFRSIVQLLAEQMPVLIAIDDLPWLDRASQAVIGYAARRFNGPIGVLATARTDDPDSPYTSWLQVAHPNALERFALRPLSLGALQTVIATHLGRRLSRPLVSRIHQISGGNPFYAIELARTADAYRDSGQVSFPSSLKTLVAQRLGVLGEQASHVLLAAACMTKPTVEELAEATNAAVADVVGQLEYVEQQGIVTLQGNRVRFTHPLLSYGVYTQAGADQRRAMHRQLASLGRIPELRARHLALAAVSADGSTLQELDTAADTAAARGAPSAAAELLELAIGLGGDDPIRRLRVAEQHFRAGSFEAADNHLQTLVEMLPPGMLRAVALLLRGAVYGYGDRFAEAAEIFTRGIADAGDSPGLRVQGLLLLSLALGVSGDMDGSVDCARRAVADADLVADAATRSQALALWVQVSFMHGLGTDDEALRTALELEDPNSSAPASLQPSAIAAINCAWTGNLREARTKLAAVQQRCDDRGNEVDVVWAAQFRTMVELWLGNYDEAAHIAEDAVDRATQIGGQLPLIDALTAQAAVAAHQGREEQTRRLANAAIDSARKHRLGYKIAAPTATLAFLDVSVSNFTAALTTLSPLLAAFDPAHGTEIMSSGFLPDAIETLVALGRLDDAEPLIAALETNGVRLDRPWMLATGARGRAELLAARADLEAAEAALAAALQHHERLPMPFERARTQLVLGQLQRRRRHRQAAERTVVEALNAFVALGAPLWAARARSELALADAAQNDKVELSPSELRIAECAAAGLSNRAIADQLFVSQKTVEMNLSRVYRKLGIRSRAQLHTELNHLGA